MTDNAVVDLFYKGGWIMWPILLTSFVGAVAICYKMIWWGLQAYHRDNKKLAEIYRSLTRGDIQGAEVTSRNSKDTRIRILAKGLTHFNPSLEEVLQLSAANELKYAESWMIVLDTVVTLAPLEGLLGTVTGLMKAFFKLGNSELAMEGITGGIAEALIATACGLSIAIISLVFLNYFSAKIAAYEEDLETACTNLLIAYKTPHPSKAKTSKSSEYEDTLVST